MTEMENVICLHFFSEQYLPHSTPENEMET